MKFSLSQLLVFMTVLAVVVVYRENIARVVFAEDAPFLPVLISFVFISVATYIIVAMQSGYASMMTGFCYHYGLLGVLRILVGRQMLGLHLNHLSNRLFEDGDLTLAAKAITKAIDLNPTEGAYWVNRGAILKEAGRIDDALADLSRGIELNSNLPNAHVHRGYIYLEKGMIKKAFDDLSCHPCKHIVDGRVAYYRGHTREELHDWESAAKDYELAWDLDHTLTDSVVALARLQAACPEESLRDGKKAIENAHRVCVLTEWSDWRSLSVLAAGYAEAGDFKLAVKFAQQAYDIAPDDEKGTRLARIQLYERSAPLRLPLSDGC